MFWGEFVACGVDAIFVGALLFVIGGRGGGWAGSARGNGREFSGGWRDFLSCRVKEFLG